MQDGAEAINYIKRLSGKEQCLSLTIIRSNKDLMCLEKCRCVICTGTSKNFGFWMIEFHILRECHKKGKAVMDGNFDGKEVLSLRHLTDVASSRNK